MVKLLLIAEIDCVCNRYSCLIFFSGSGKTINSSCKTKISLNIRISGEVLLAACRLVVLWQVYDKHSVLLAHFVPSA